MAKAKYKKDKQGYYATKVWDGTFDEYGRKHRVYLRSRKSSADLEKMVQELRSQVDAGTAIRKTELSFADYAEQWVQVKQVYTRNTQRQYSDIIRYYIRPALSSVPLSQFTKLHLQLLISRSADHPRTCQLIRRTVLQIAESAVDDRYLPESVLRPLRSVALPKYRRPERRVLTDQEKAAVMSADFTPMQRCFVWMIYGCGLRRGEALALTPADIDLSRQTVRICRSVELINNSSGLKPPKSQNGVRSVPLPGFLTEFLKEYIPTIPGDYLVHNRSGGLMTQSAFRRMWEQILEKMNAAAGGTKQVKVIHGLTPHIFRHTYCTELCYQVPTITVKKVAQLLGDDESMVMKVYSHIMEEKEDAPAAVERIFATR